MTTKMAGGIWVAIILGLLLLGLLFLWIFKSMNTPQNKRDRRPKDAEIANTASTNSLPSPTNTISPSGYDGIETIFVSIPSYRDPEAPYTIESLFNTAVNPDRVYIGLCQQNLNPQTTQEIGDRDIIEAYEELCRQKKSTSRSSQIRIIRMSAEDARGPMLARSLIEQLYKDENYYLMIDSHTQFASGWDRDLIQELETLIASGETAKPVLTMYPDGYDRNHRINNINVSKPGSYLKVKGRNDKGYIEFEGVPHTKILSSPKKNVGWGACFSFAKASMLKEVPYDPQCPFVFIGEEPTMALRLYTHGYDLYAPTRMYVYTIWSRQYRKTFWENPKRKELEDLGYSRLHDLFGSPSRNGQASASNEWDLRNSKHPNSEKYGYGKIRSPQSFYEKYGWSLNSEDPIRSSARDGFRS